MADRPVIQWARLARILFVEVVVAGLVAANVYVFILARYVGDLRARVACLEQPWQASSTSMTVVAGRRVQGPVTRTDCLHPR